ncbi:MAG TPA: hypothetical protein DCF87_06100 [Opitutae bacterium]|nr:hypothetical protein [Opitutae bacterium]
MKGIIHSFFSVQLLAVISVGSLLAQSPSEMITRDQYLDKLEERFRDATTELNEISGIKFDVPEASLSQTSAAQSDFDKLPGPIGTKSPDMLSDDEIILQIMREDNKIEEPKFDTNGEVNEDLNQTVAEKVLEVKVIPPRYLEDEKGSFYFQPFIGFSLVSGGMKIAESNLIPDADHDVGFGLGVSYGKRWGNLTGEVHLSHYSNDFSGAKESVGVGLILVDGSTEITNLGARLGYGVPLGEKGSIRAAAGFGFAERRTISNFSGNIASSLGESATLFSYDFLVAMAYEIGIGWDASLAYRVLNVNEYLAYDAISAHLFEIGLTKNF